MQAVPRVVRTLSPLSTSKGHLRKRMSILLDTVPEQDIQRQSTIVTDHILSSPWFLAAKRISIYIHTAGEIQTDRLVMTALNQGKILYVPQFKKKNPRMRLLRLSSIEEFNNLDCTLWNIRQPHQDSTAQEYTDGGPIDLVLMPGVAFTKDGDRLGHGMGYYDRLLAEHEDLFGSQPYKVALSLNEQIVDDVPIGDMDVPMDKILSESTIDTIQNAADGM